MGISASENQKESFEKNFRDIVEKTLEAIEAAWTLYKELMDYALLSSFSCNSFHTKFGDQDVDFSATIKNKVFLLSWTAISLGLAPFIYTLRLFKENGLWTKYKKTFLNVYFLTLLLYTMSIEAQSFYLNGRKHCQG